MKLLSLRLRGAVGIYDGLGLDEIAVDFTQLSPGLVAIQGPNGSGKSSILESLHAYRRLASRVGSLAEHFRLRDSYRDLAFEMDGHVYRALIMVDAKTTKQEAYLYKDGLAITDGKTTSYDLEVEKLLGSPELFFASVFASQGAESISSLTAGKRKELFMELLGLQRFEVYYQRCKTELDGISESLAGVRARITFGQEQCAWREAVLNSMEDGRVALTTISARHSAAETALKSSREEVEGLRSRFEADAQRRKSVAAIEEEMRLLRVRQAKTAREFEVERKNLEAELAATIRDMDAAKAVLAKEEEIAAGLKALSVLRAEKASLDEKERAFREVERREYEARAAYQATVHARQQQLADIERGVQNLGTQRDRLFEAWKSEEKSLRQQIADAERQASLVNDVPCNTIEGLPEKCKLLSGAIAARENLKDLNAKLGDLLDPSWRLGHGQKDLEDRMEVARRAHEEILKVAPPPMPDLTAEKESVGYDDKRHTKVRRHLQTAEGRGWEGLSSACASARAVLEEKARANQSIVERLEASRKKSFEAATDIEVECEAKDKAIGELLKAPFVDASELTAARTAMEAHEKDFKRLSEEQLEISAKLKAGVMEVDRLEALAQEVAGLRSKEMDLVTQNERWSLLAQACSKDGIPALELDASGPEVSRIANDLLSSTFGTGYQIQFETTRVSKDKKKQIETFEIRVLAGETEKHIEDLSGGERVWIETAIREAIAIYMSRKSGREYLTTESDERDGALEPVRKQQFLDLLRESFRLGRRHQTFIISQTPDVWGQIPQRIELVPSESLLRIVS